jgi:hypothetical protein
LIVNNKPIGEKTMSNISITLPLDNKEALQRASDMLMGLANDLTGETLGIKSTVEETKPAASVKKETTSDNDELPLDHIDTKGLRWDDRIHVASRAILKDGSYRLKGKATPELIEQVKQEQQAMQAAADAANGVAPEGALEFEIGANGEAAPVTTQSNIASQVLGNSTAQPEPTPTNDEPLDFASLVQSITARQAQKAEFSSIVDAVLAENNVNGLTSLLSYPDLVPVIGKRLDELWQD